MNANEENIMTKFPQLLLLIIQLEHFNVTSKINDCMKKTEGYI